MKGILTCIIVGVDARSKLEKVTASVLKCGRVEQCLRLSCSRCGQLQSEIQRLMSHVLRGPRVCVLANLFSESVFQITAAASGPKGWDRQLLRFDCDVVCVCRDGVSGRATGCVVVRPPSSAESKVCVAPNLTSESVFPLHSHTQIAASMVRFMWFM